MKLFSLMLLFGVAFATVVSAQNLVLGGDFESPIIPSGSPYLLDVTPADWTGTGDLVVQGYGGSVPSGNGNQWLDLNPGTSAGSGIFQSITLSAGTTYSLSFLFNGGGGGTTTEIAYSLHTGSVTSLSGIVSTAGMDVYGGTPWGVFSASFTPSVGGAESLIFTPNGGYSGGFIDAVSLTVVPEPDTATLVVIGALLVAGTRQARTMMRT